jgi:hypothetical protein
MQYASRIAAAIFFCGTLAACGTVPVSVPAVVTVVEPPAAAPQKVVRIGLKALETSMKACRDGKTILAIASAPVMPDKVRIPATIVRDFCGALLSGRVPDAASDRTPQDIMQTIDAIRNIFKRNPRLMRQATLASTA